MCHLLVAMDRFAHLKSEISDPKLLSTRISKQLGAWAFSLQESDIGGTKFLTGRKPRRLPAT